MMRRALCIALLCFGAACRSTDGPPAVLDAGPPGEKEFGEVCADSRECDTNLCVSVSDTRSICSGACDETHTCPEAPNWFCVQHFSLEVTVCACESDADEEICDDLLDNDCDGTIDCPGDHDPDPIEPPMCPGAPECEPPPPLVDPCDEDPTACGGCRDDADCDDGIACTRDRCYGRGCFNRPDDNLCDDDEVCLLREDCSPARACADDLDCVDTDACTRAEHCDPSTKVCRFVLLDGDADERFPIVCGGNDCDDDDATVYPGAIDVCDGADNDCDGVADPPEATLRCAPDRVCFEGACLCDSDHVPCDGRCFDPEQLESDSDNCGACGVACLSGFTCATGACVDVDECASGSPCGDHSSCTNSQGSFGCTCEAGYSSPNGANCMDIDECSLNSDDCDAMPDACVNVDGSFECTCPGGYQGDGVGVGGCVDVDECQAGSDSCDAADRCVNTPGDYACSKPVLQVGTGGRHSCAVLEGGSLKCWGTNASGQLGVGDTLSRGDMAGEMGDALPAVNLGTGRSALYVTLGDVHTCAVLDDANVKCWGNGANGRLGLGNTTTRGASAATMGDALPTVELGTGRSVALIAAGQGHTCVILDDGSVKCWGYNVYGQLGLGNTVNRGDNAGEMGDSLPAVDLGTDRTAVALAAGERHNCAVLDDASVKCWGYNGFGQLGLGNVATRGDGASEMGDALPAVELGTGRTATAVSVGRAHSCALLDDASVKCWGENGQGQLGLGNVTDRGTGAGQMGDALPAVDLGSGRTARSIHAGAYHTCAVLDDDSVKCWGNATNGELGSGMLVNLGDGAGELGDALPVVDLGTGHAAVKAIASAWYHNCALLTDDTLKCWGDNAGGQLGLGSIADQGGQAFQMGDYLPGVPLGL